MMIRFARVCFLFFCFFSLLAKEKTDVLFYLQDAGETYGLLPVIEAFEEKKIDYRVLVAGAAEEIVSKSGVPKEKIRFFKDYGADFGPFWQRSYRLCGCYVARLVDEIEVREVVTGVAFEAQGQVLEAYQNRGVAGFVFWDNFNFQGNDPYFLTAHSVEEKANFLLLPASSLEVGFMRPSMKQSAKVVGHPSLDTWRTQIAAVDKAVLREKLRIDPLQKVIVFIGGYGADYEDAFRLFLQSAALEPEFIFLVQPHPKSNRVFERRALSEASSYVRLLENEATTVEAVALADVVLCHQSTVAFQALAACKPVVHILPPNQQYTSLPLEKGLAYRVSDPSELHEALDKVTKTRGTEFYELLGIPERGTEECAAAILEGLKL